jgi:hypothetical protein
MSLDELRHEGVRLAREMIVDIYWNFGLTSEHVPAYVASVQRRLLGRADV